jgi:hypothetical protein
VAYLEELEPQDETKNLTYYEEKYGDHDAVCIYSKFAIDITGSQDLADFQPTTYYISHERRLVLNPENSKFTTFELKLPDDTELEKVIISAISPDGEVDIYDEKNLNIEETSEYIKTYSFVYPNVKKGTIVEEGFELKEKRMGHFLDNQFIMQYRIPCEKLEFEFAYPDWWEIDFKAGNEFKYGSYRNVKDDRHNKMVLKYKATEVPALVEEPYSPQDMDVADCLQFRVTKFELAKYMYFPVDSWEEFVSRFKHSWMKGDWYKEHKIKDQTSKILSGTSSQEEILDAVLNYVSEKIAVSQDTERKKLHDIIKDGIANQYDVTALVRAMLINGGLPADYLLVNSKKDGSFDEDYYSWRQFYIPAVRTVVDGSVKVIFPHIKNLPRDYIPYTWRGQKALVVKKENKDTEFWATPDTGLIDNLGVENYELEVYMNGKVSVTETKTLQGVWAYFVRDLISDLDEEELEDAILELVTYDDGEIDLESYEIENLDESNTSLVINLEYNVDNLVTITPDEVVFRTAGLFSPVSLKKYKIDTEKRSNPIVIYGDEEYRKTINIKYPPNWSMETDLKDLEYENDFGRIRAEYEVSEGLLSVSQTRILNRCSAPKDKINDLLKLTGRTSNMYLPTIIFRSNSE